MQGRLASVLSLLLFLSTAAYSWAQNRAFDPLLATLKARSQASASPVALTVFGETKGRDLLLTFHLTNVSTASLSFRPEQLPWGGPYAITWVALTVDGRPLPRAAVIYDLVYGPSISVPAGASLDGSYRLSWLLKMDAVPADTDLMIFWAYSPPGLGAEKASPISSGVTWLHTSK
jgi:hypothetical protein